MFHICQDEIIPLVAAIPFIGIYLVRIRFYVKEKFNKLKSYIKR